MKAGKDLEAVSDGSQRRFFAEISRWDRTVCSELDEQVRLVYSDSVCKAQRAHPVCDF
jgi:hypothetical protein